MNQGMQLLVLPVKDLAGAETLYGTLLDTEPYADSPYYVGFKVGDQEIGLDPNGHRAGATGSPRLLGGRRHRGSCASLPDAGAQTQQEVKDVGRGKLIAIVKDADGNLIGLTQSP